jgi:hypothetical protein
MISETNLRFEIPRTILFWVMQRYPAVKDSFKHVGVDNPMGANFTAHASRIHAAWDMLLNMFHNPAAQDAAIEHLAEQHAARPGVKKEHLMFLGKIFIRLTSQMTDDVDTMSWEACVTPLFEKLSSKLPD